MNSLLILVKTMSLNLAKKLLGRQMAENREDLEITQPASVLSVPMDAEVWEHVISKPVHRWKRMVIQMGIQMTHAETGSITNALMDQLDRKEEEALSNYLRLAKDKKIVIQGRGGQYVKMKSASSNPDPEYSGPNDEWYRGVRLPNPSKARHYPKDPSECDCPDVKLSNPRGMRK